MSKFPPPTETMKISDVRGQLNTLVNRIYGHRARIIIEKSGIPVAALVSLTDLAQLKSLDRQTLEQQESVAGASEGFEDVSDEELMREALRAVAEVRAEMRAEREQAEALAR